MPLRAPVLILLLATACASVRTRPEDRPRLALPAETLDGDPIVIGGEGPVRLVDVWASWCDPCRAAGPRAAAVVRERKGVEEIALSVDDDVGRVRQYIAKHPVPGVVVHFHGGWAGARKAGLKGIPLFIVLDRRGGIVATITGDSRNLEGALTEALDSAAAP